jgi:Fur family transcriptional regulator, iron response regulator
VTSTEASKLLSSHGIRPTWQRVAIAMCVLETTDHPSADEAWRRVRKLPQGDGISRATVYNTLNLFVEHGLVRDLVLEEGRVVFDPNVAPHHHFVDDATGRIVDVPFDSLSVSQISSLDGFDVRAYEVVLRGTLKSGA